MRKKYILDNLELNSTELAMMLAFGKITNPYRQGDRDTYHSIVFALNELNKELTV